MRNVLLLLAVLGAAVVIVFSVLDSASEADPGPPTFPVEVVNSEVYPVLVRHLEEAREPFQVSESFRMEDGEGVVSGVVVSVPPGRRFVIEFATIAATLPAEQELQSARLQLNAVPHFLAFARLNSGNNGYAQWGLSQNVTLSATGDVTFVGGRASGAGDPVLPVHIHVSLSGYMIDE